MRDGEWGKGAAAFTSKIFSSPYLCVSVPLCCIPEDARICTNTATAAIAPAARDVHQVIVH